MASASPGATIATIASASSGATIASSSSSADIIVTIHSKVGAVSNAATARLALLPQP